MARGTEEHATCAYEGTPTLLCSVDELPREGRISAFDVGTRRIAVANVEGRLYAFDDTCTHRPSSLSLDGRVVDGSIECGWHRSRFDPETGAVLGPPARDPLRVYELRVCEGDVLLMESMTAE